MGARFAVATHEDPGRALLFAVQEARHDCGRSVGRQRNGHPERPFSFRVVHGLLRGPRFPRTGEEVGRFFPSHADQGGVAVSGQGNAAPRTAIRPDVSGSAQPAFCPAGSISRASEQRPKRHPFGACRAVRRSARCCRLPRAPPRPRIRPLRPLPATGQAIALVVPFGAGAGEHPHRTLAFVILIGPHERRLTVSGDGCVDTEQAFPLLDRSGQLFTHLGPGFARARVHPCCPPAEAGAVVGRGSDQGGFAFEGERDVTAVVAFALLFTAGGPLRAGRPFPEPFEFTKNQAAPAPLLSAGPPINAVTPPLSSATRCPNSALPLSSPPVSLQGEPFWPQLAPARLKTHAAPALLLSPGPPTRASAPLAEIATLVPKRAAPNWHSRSQLFAGLAPGAPFADERPDGPIVAVVARTTDQHRVAIR